MQNSSSISEPRNFEPESVPSKLWIFDFDETLTLRHTHKHKESGIRVHHANYENVEAQAQNLRNPKIIKFIMETLHARGDTLSIASFHNGRDLDDMDDKGARYISAYLKPLKLNFELSIEAYKPKTTIGLKSSPSTKNEHVQKLIERFNDKRDAQHQIKPGSPQVFLIDDDLNNLKAALDAGIIREENLIKVDVEKTSSDYLLKLVRCANIPTLALEKLLQDLQAQHEQTESIVLASVLANIDHPSHELANSTESPKSPGLYPLFNEEIRRKTQSGTLTESDPSPNHSRQSSPKKLRRPSFLSNTAATPASPSVHQTNPKLPNFQGFRLFLDTDSSADTFDESSITRPTPLNF